MSLFVGVSKEFNAIMKMSKIFRQYGDICIFINSIFEKTIFKRSFFNAPLRAPEAGLVKKS